MINLTTTHRFKTLEALGLLQLSGISPRTACDLTNNLLGEISQLRKLLTCAVVSGRPPVNLYTYIRAVPTVRMSLEFYTGGLL